MSKYDRYKKTADGYIYPHKHCKKCGEMIEEAYTYCSDCYRELKEKKKKRGFLSRIKIKKKQQQTN